jgi:SSS family solute:Na+ symporter
MSSLSITGTYFTLIFAISFYISRSNKSIQDFLVAKRELGILAIIPMLFSELIAGSGTVGNSATAYRIGISSVWMNWGTAIGCLVTVLLVNKFYRVMSLRGKMSVAESFASYFDDRTRIVMMCITAIVYTIIFSLQPAAAAGILSPMLNVDSNTIIWFVGISFIAIAVLGGLKGIARVNFVHAIVMYLGLGFATFVVLRYIGGVSTLKAELPQNYFNLMEPGFFTVFAWVFGTAVNVPAGSMVAGVVFGAKSLKTANKGMIIASLLIIPFAVLISLLGMSAKASGLEIAANNAIFTITSHISPTIAGISSMAILAAILSTAPIMLMMVGGTITRDLYKGIINKDATSKQQLIVTKVVIIVIGLLGIYLGLNTRSILGRLLGALQIRSVSGLILMIALYWPRVNNKSAFWSIAFGGIVAAVWFFAGNPYGIEPLWPSIIVAFAVLVPLTVMSKEKVYKGNLEYKASLEEFKDRL